MMFILLPLVIISSTLGKVHGQGQITGFTLINAATDTVIGPIDDGGTIDLVSTGTQLSMRADVTAGAIGSVKMLTDGQTTATENVAPYALGGNSGSDYNPVTALAAPGSHTISATVFSGPGGSGTAGSSLSITVLVDDNSPPTPTPPPIVPQDSDVPAYPSSPQGTVSGELRKWHKVTLGFEGPTASETDAFNPFTNYRLDVVFAHADSGAGMTVPGYFAADGNAANSRANSGNVWLAHFAPDRAGTWTWTAEFTEGSMVAQNGGGSSAGFFDGASGSFDVGATDKAGRDHRGKGRLQYVGEHHLQFAENGEFFLKAGADSPENFLAYEGFDNTPNNGNRRKSWAPHEQDYNSNDPTWADGTGFGIIGAVNYLSGKGANAFSFLPMNINGDDKNVFPYISDNSGNDRQRIDVSKTAQWEVVFEHADHKGMFLHFKTQETENDQLLDGGALGDERKLYYRELIARFSHHLALNWNLGEENTNSDSERKAFANFFKEIDPYDHPIVIHTFPGAKDSVYGQLVGHPGFDGASLQSGKGSVFSDTLKWRQESAAAGRKWVVANDEQGNAQTGVVPDTDDPNHDVVRKDVLWGNIMAGGAGVEYYFGYSYSNSDLTCEDFRSRSNMWDQSRYALEFFENNAVPFWDMSNADSRVGNARCLAQTNNEHFVVYLEDGGSTNIDLVGSTGTTYTVKWYDPRNGGPLQDGSVTTVGLGSNQGLGNAPNNGGLDWVVLLRSDTLPTLPPSPATPSPTPMVTDSPTVAPTVPTDGLHPDIVKVIDVEGENPGGLGWADSYSVGDECFCATNFDHDIGPVQVDTPLGTKTVRQVCELLGPGPGLAGRPIYNDVQCGNGPPNTAGDEETCPGRVDIGREGCGHIGPVWNFSRFLTPAPTLPPVSTTTSPTPSPVVTTSAPTKAPVATTAPTSSPPATDVGSVTGFTLVDADADAAIRGLTAGETIILAVDGVSLNVIAEVSGDGPVGSVEFGLDGNTSFRTENVWPYCLGGDNNSNYLPVSQLLQTGEHIVAATPYSEKSKQGTRGATVEIAFTVSENRRNRALRLHQA